jgi:regulator of replication initiation timing
VDVISAINNSISIVTRLREISKNASEAEFRNLLADLSNELADAKIKIASLKEQIAVLVEENHTLKNAKPEKKEKPALKWGCYKFEGDEGLYCTACYDTKSQKNLTTRLFSNRRMCPVCKAVFGT